MPAGWHLPQVVSDILSRRSVSPRNLVEPGPDSAQIGALIDAACAAPDHRRLRPWRFILIAPQSRTRLADLFQAAAVEAHGDLTAEAAQRAREKAANGACLIAVVARIRTDIADVPVHEQWVSVGAALQNILLTATAMGFGAMIVSGGKVTTRALQDGLGLSCGEHLLGFVAIGTPIKAPSPAKRPTAQQVSSVW